MKVQKIHVKNLKAVSELSVDFNGCTAIITGKNDSGKSSFLKSLPERIRGNKPEIVLRHGEKDGFAEWELTDGSKFIWTFDAAGEKLKYITPQNITIAITKDIAKRYFPPVFDIDVFLQSAPKKQLEIIQKTFNVDFTQINAEYKKAYDDRTYKNNVLKSAEAKTSPILENLPDDEIDINDILTESVEAEKKNAKIDAMASQNELDKKELKVLLKKVDELKKQIASSDQWLLENTKIDTTVISQKRNEAITLNKKIAENNNQRQFNNAADIARKEAENADAEVKRIEAEKQKMVESIKLPEEFKIDGEGITYKGFPITKDQLSSSGIYIASLKLAHIGIGEVKTLHFDASTLGRKNLNDIEKWATENDLQLLIERPDFEDGEIVYELIGENK